MLRRLDKVYVSWDKRLQVRLPCCDDPRTQLSVLRGLDWDSNKDMGSQVLVQLAYWPLTHDTMQALKGLADWECGLDISTCTWPHSDDPAAYMALAKYVPTSFTFWCIPSTTPQPVRTALYAGINAHRAQQKCETRLAIASGQGNTNVDVGAYVSVYTYAE